MTSPRRQLVDPGVPGYYHYVSRCVRRAFLCGEDRLTGRDFGHGRQWGLVLRLMASTRAFKVFWGPTY